MKKNKELRVDREDFMDEFLPYRLIDLVKFKHMDFVVVLMGADDPEDLLREEVLEFAKEKAEYKLKSSCTFIEATDVIVNGQNELPIRFFTFRKYR